MRNGSLVLFMAVCCTASSYAAEPLTGDQVKELVSGNTVYGEARKGWKAIRYLAPDGKMIQYLVDKDKYAEGDWNIKGNELCWGFERARTNCGKLVKKGDEYHFLKDDTKHIFTIKKIESGNSEKM